jgi:hypothetical protein
MNRSRISIAALAVAGVLGIGAVVVPRDAVADGPLNCNTALGCPGGTQLCASYQAQMGQYLVTYYCYQSET